MDFSFLPPEITSRRLYTGPGSGPLIAAATAWHTVADDLDNAATGIASVLATVVADAWRGPSSTAMANAASTMLTWMHRTAAQAQQTAGQATAAAGAFQTAYAMVVPPPLIAANRAQLLALIASNLFGQNATAIAATEAHYEQMWAQDVAAMQGYSLAASTASELTPFTAPTAVTAGPALAQPLQAAAAPAQAVSTPGLLTYLLQIPSLTSAAASVSSSSFGGASIYTTNHALAVNALRDEAQGIGPFWVGAPAAAGPPPSSTTGVPRPAPVSAALRAASGAGRLSVPAAWASTARPVAAIATALPTPAAPATPLPASGVAGEALLGTLAGRGVSGAAAKTRRRTVMPRPPAAG
ncbi:MAG TPA: PPE family protein [Mycolicibacillus parakoreensis]|nr:PPE family protein [Mycolicibacillus parakoreensis]